MSKLLKIMSAILALIMVVSLFAACGNKTETDVDDNDKKIEDKVEKEEEETEPAPTPEEILVGTWNSQVPIEESLFLSMIFKFEADGTLTTELTEENYNKFLNDIMDAYLETEGFNDFTDDEKAAFIAAFGATTVDELKDTLRSAYMAENPYENEASKYEFEGTWKLDGDKITIDIDGDVMTGDTALSKGEKTFTVLDDDGDGWIFTKI